MLPENYNIRYDESFIEFSEEKNYSKSSREKYRNALMNYTNFHQLTLDELREEAEEEEDNNIRLSRRRIKRRLITFRKHLIEDMEYTASSIKTNMICVKAYYRYYGIEIPEIQNIPLPPSPNDSIEFEDLPTVNDFKAAIESTKLLKHKALFLFALCTGSARNELANFTFKQFLDGVNPYCNNTARTPADIIAHLDGKCEKNDENDEQVIPIFRMIRGKTNYNYHTVITPECTQFMINYLKAEGMGLRDEDPFFQLTNWGISTAFKLINEKFNWGKRGSRGYFTTHRIRSLHASLIEEENFANYIEGRKPDPIMHAYFKRDPNRVREKYKEHMYKFTIYAHYNVMINSDAYRELQDQLEEEQQRHEADKEKYEAELAQLRALNVALSNQMGDMQNQITTIAQENNIKRIQDYMLDNEMVNEHNLSKRVIDLYLEDIEEKDVMIDKNYLETLITRAYNHSLYNGENEFLDKEEYVVADSLYLKLKDDLDRHRESMFIGTNIRLSDAQSKKINEKLDEHLTETWKKKGKIDYGYISKVIEDIILNG